MTSNGPNWSEFISLKALIDLARVRGQQDLVTELFPSELVFLQTHGYQVRKLKSLPRRYWIRLPGPSGPNTGT